MKKGTISVNTENIFPIIKKWLYSDKDIFLRELVSNGCDAITKLKKLADVKEASIDDCGEFFVEIVLDKKQKQIKIIDNGIGMTEDEVVKFITQVAFSGAEEFIKKYQSEKEENRIIGHFGLGFYSAFMVAERVDINTLSYLPGAKSVFWSCDGGTSYEMSEGDKTARGTEITLHISDDNKEFLEEGRLREILNKYCAFLPVPIYFYKAGDKRGDAVNDTSPLWLKKPSECTDEEYKEFYKKVFFDFNDPLFYIHLNVDYPFNLKGILYFPKLRHEFDPAEGQIKLYNNQVFVADNVKEVIPEFLMLLKGVIDCPDLPLNVSRSFLQNDGYATRVSAHITKKIADKLASLYKNERENYNKYWDDINPFIKFGCLKDEKFYDKVRDIIIFKTTGGAYKTISELAGDEGDIYYVSSEVQQAQYIEMFKKQGLEAVILPTVIDNHFISFLEAKNTKIRFKRIDSGIADSLKEERGEDSKGIVELFKKALNNDKLKIEAVPLKSEDFPAVLLLGEQSRRMLEMARLYGAGMGIDSFSQDETLTINLNHPIIKKLSGAEDNARTYIICRQIYDMARMAQRPLDGEALTEFIKRSGEIMDMALK